MPFCAVFCQIWSQDMVETLKVTLIFPGLPFWMKDHRLGVRSHFFSPWGPQLGPWHAISGITCRVGEGRRRGWGVVVVVVVVVVTSALVKVPEDLRKEWSGIFAIWHKRHHEEHIKRRLYWDLCDQICFPGMGVCFVPSFTELIGLSSLDHQSPLISTYPSLGFPKESACNARDLGSTPESGR